jgi:hypothetical protein
MDTTDLPRFQFTNNSAKNLKDKSGIAKWTYYDNPKGILDVFVTELKFKDFIDANDMNNVVVAAYEAGVRAGKQEILNKLLSVTREYGVA